MNAKIFYRERSKVGTGKQSPRFKLVAVAGIDMKIYAKHLRKQELEKIAVAVGAELVELKVDRKDRINGNDEIEVE